MEPVGLLDGGKCPGVVSAVASWLDHPLVHMTLSLPFAGRPPSFPLIL